MNAARYIAIARAFRTQGVMNPSAQAVLLTAREMETPTMTYLSDVAGVGTAAMTGIVDKLEKSGLVERVKHMDRRKTSVQLTQRGQEVANSAIPWKKS